MPRAARAATLEQMAELVAIGYPDETSALAAEKEAQRLADELIIQPDAIAAIVRHADGKYQVTTTHHAVDSGASWGMFWGLFFGLLFFVPVLGMAMGASLGALFGKLEQAGIDKEFQAQVREMLRPGSSALFLVVEDATPETAVRALGRYGGTIIKTSFSKEAEEKVQCALHGAEDRETVTV
jgi:uncharacterized membrane protein